MRFLSYTVRRVAVFALLALSLACNKDLPVAEPLTPPNRPGPTIGEILNTDTSFSFLKAAVTRAGLLDELSDSISNFTVFAPNNNAFRISGIPSEAVINALPEQQLVALVQYHVVSGVAVSPITQNTSFPNLQLPSNLVLQAPFFRMSLFVSGTDTSAFVNTIPVTGTTNSVPSNGYINTIAALLAPPTTTLKQRALADTSLTFLLAAIQRADSGQVNLGKFDSLLNYPPVNFTVFAPNNDAFRALLAGFGLPPSTTAFNFLPVQTVRGIVAYHLLGVRAFSVNLPPASTNVPTLLRVTPTTPPATLLVQNANGTVKVTGNGNGGAASNVVARDLHSVNGVMHKIDRVLLPQ